MCTFHSILTGLCNVTSADTFRLASESEVSPFIGSFMLACLAGGDSRQTQSTIEIPSDDADLPSIY